MRNNNSIDFHCKGSAGKEKFVVNTVNDDPYIHVVEYNRKDLKRMVGIIFYNMHKIIDRKNYVKFGVNNGRIYFEFTNKKDVHAYKLTFNGSHTVNDTTALNSTKYPRKIQTDTDARLLKFCGKDYPIRYDTAKKLYYIENTNTSKKLF